MIPRQQWDVPPRGRGVVRSAANVGLGSWTNVDVTSLSAKGKSHTRRNATLIGGGAGLGALIGGIAGGGKGAAIGAGAGAGAGTMGAYATGKKDVSFPAEHRLMFRTARQIVVRTAGRTTRA